MVVSNEYEAHSFGMTHRMCLDEYVSVCACLMEHIVNYFSNANSNSNCVPLPELDAFSHTLCVSA